jgi:putative phosphoesterase
MKLALISDLHANLPALLAIRDVLDQADRVICLGDFIGYYCQVNEVFEVLRPYDPVAVLGNHDAFLFTGCPEGVSAAVRFGMEWAERAIHPEFRQYLQGLPVCWGGRLGGRTVLLAHGSPWRPLLDYLYPDSPLWDKLAEFGYDVVAVGQTHRVVVRAGTPLGINPGSVGQSRDASAQATALVLDTTELAAEVIRRGYDPEPVLELARTNGAGAWINKHLM